MPILPPGLGQMMPPPAQMSPPGGQPMPGAPGQGAPQGVPPGLAAAAMGGMAAAGDNLDLFQRVAKMATDNPMWILMFAGMGLREALEKSGKYESKPHRSNDQLQQAGYPGVGQQPGQPSAGLLASPGGMAQQLPPGTPGLPGAG